MSSASAAPEKNGKFSDADLNEREFWDGYGEAHKECLSAASGGEAPWRVVPAGDKQIARLVVSPIVLDTFERLDMSYRKTSIKRERGSHALRKEPTVQTPARGGEPGASPPRRPAPRPSPFVFRAAFAAVAALRGSGVPP